MIAKQASIPYTHEWLQLACLTGWLSLTIWFAQPSDGTKNFIQLTAAHEQKNSTLYYAKTTTKKNINLPTNSFPRQCLANSLPPPEIPEGLLSKCMLLPSWAMWQYSHSAPLEQFPDAKYLRFQSSSSGQQQICMCVYKWPTLSVLRFLDLGSQTAQRLKLIQGACMDVGTPPDVPHCQSSRSRGWGWCHWCFGQSHVHRWPQCQDGRNRVEHSMRQEFDVSSPYVFRFQRKVWTRIPGMRPYRNMITKPTASLWLWPFWVDHMATSTCHQDAVLITSVNCSWAASFVGRFTIHNPSRSETVNGEYVHVYMYSMCGCCIFYSSIHIYIYMYIHIHDREICMKK